ncbi:hypothetical protein ABH15_10310 [Methanoculleus taiwanensis]|uniref:2'-5' RNA ligase n=2 Tax=Methanoculleus taiwanensis TaxID=1550565 RepID=A0A498H0K7_9EURY|nr:hypothetical protein ABH15_10310 [Methanoculleus taiwanensis]
MPMPPWPDCYNLHITMHDGRFTKIAREIAGAFRLTSQIQWYPHITLVSHFWPRANFSEERLKAAIEDAAEPFDHLTVSVDGFIRLTNHSVQNQAIAHRVIPSRALIGFWHPLSRRLFHFSVFPPNIPIAQAENRTDLYPEEKALHITIARHLHQREADLLWEELQRHRKLRPPQTTFDVVRVTLGKNMRIYAEYDLPRRQWLTGNEMYSKVEWAKTEEAYRRGTALQPVQPSR